MLEIKTDGLNSRLSQYQVNLLAELLQDKGTVAYSVKQCKKLSTK